MKSEELYLYFTTATFANALGLSFHSRGEVGTLSEALWDQGFIHNLKWKLRALSITLNGNLHLKWQT